MNERTYERQTKGEVETWSRLVVFHRSHPAAVPSTEKRMSNHLLFLAHIRRQQAASRLSYVANSKMRKLFRPLLHCEAHERLFSSLPQFLLLLLLLHLL